jgi:hypothetical protein
MIPTISRTARSIPTSKARAMMAAIQGRILGSQLNEADRSNVTGSIDVSRVRDTLTRYMRDWNAWAERGTVADWMR